MTHDHVGVMLHRLLAVALPDGYRSIYRERYDSVIDHTFRDVTIAPDDLDVATFDFGTPGAHAHIRVNDDGDTYTVGVFATDVGYNVQSAGRAVAFTTADQAVRRAVGQIRDHLIGQARGW